jgi:hypothetical protein
MPAITLISAQTIAAAATTTGTDFAITTAKYLTVQSKFLYGAGGTATRVFVQTTLDGGATWVDIANHDFAQTAATKISSVTSDVAPASQAFAPGDAALTTNTIIQGVIGSRIRAKVVSTGTYTGATSIDVRVVAK